MFWLILAKLVTINNQWRSWSSIHRCSDWSGPTGYYQQSIKILIIHTQMFWLIRAYWLLSTINQDLDHPYTDVRTDHGLTIKILIIHTQMFWLIRALLVTINNQSRSWSSIHRCSDWSWPNLSLSTINEDLDHPYTDVQTDQGLTCHYQQSIKILIIHTQMFWLIRVLLVTINNQWRSWSSIHRCSDWSWPNLSLSTINEDLDHPYTDVQTDQGLTCHYQLSIKILVIHRCSDWSGSYLSLSTINQDLDLDHPYTDVLTDHPYTDGSGPYLSPTINDLSLSTINEDLDHPYNEDLDHPYTDVLTDQGLTCHYQQSMKILIIHTQMFWLILAKLVTINNQWRSWSSIHRCSDWSGSYLSLSTINQGLGQPYTDGLTDQGLLVTINNQSRSWSSIHRCSDWSGPYLSLSTINGDLDHPYTDVLTDQSLLVTINNQWRSWSSIHRCSDWSGPYLSLSTINEDLDHPYTDVLTDQGLTSHYQQSMKILIIHTQMFWLIRDLLVTINNQWRSWSSIHRCSDWSGPYWSLSTINEDLDHPYTDVLTDQGLTSHYQQSMKILIIHTQMFWLIRDLLVTINNQWRSWSSIHRCSDWSGPTGYYQQSIKILIIHTQMFWLIRALLVTINNQWRSWSSIHRCSDWSWPNLSLSTINEDLDHPYTDVLTDQGLLVTINNQSRSWSSIHRCSDWSGPYLSLSTINGDLDHPYTDVLTDQGLTSHYQQSMKILVSHTQMFWLIRALLVTINNQWRILLALHRCSD